MTTRLLTFPSGDLSLEGALHLPAGKAGLAESPPAAGVVVCHPHPQYGGDMENNVVLAACEALASGGLAALRFNLRGVGSSDGALADGAGASDDVRAALAYLGGLAEIDIERLGLAGYSSGAMLAAEVASAGVAGVDSGVAALALISPPVAHGDLRASWGCPTLVLAGDQDHVAPSERLQALVAADDVELRIVSGVDHFWSGSERELGETLAEFFAQHLRR